MFLENFRNRPKLDKYLTESVPSYYVRKLLDPIYNTVWNITNNGWFTPIPIYKKLLNDYNLIMVRTIYINKQKIQH